MADTTPIYNLKAVINETGLSPATLRAWERRYGLIKPQRSPGGHRLYSRQDIDQLKWLIARQKEGLSISSAAEMWKSRAVTGSSELGVVQTQPVISTTGKVMLENLRDQWISACLAFDELAANQVLDQAFAISPPETICIELLQKGLVRIGQGWYGGLISVQQEHFASAIAMRRLNVLLEALPPSTRPHNILVACPPGEEHEVILLLVTYLLKRNGWNAIYLGSNVPIENLDATLQTTKPALVISAAQTLAGAAALSEMSQYLLSQGIHLAFGGGIFSLIPGMSKCISGYYLGTELVALPGIIELLIIAPPDIPHKQPVTSEYIHLFEIFNRQQSAILAQVDSLVSGGPIALNHVALANQYLTQLIDSALRLGDIQLMDPAISWLDGLLVNYGFSRTFARQYFVAYQQAIQDRLGIEAEPILEWFRKIE